MATPESTPERSIGWGHYALRPYGPGKFDTMLDAYVYELSMHGCDDESGDVTETGWWYGLLRGLTVEMPFSDVAAGRLTDDEIGFLRQHAAGAIVGENSQGFVTVEYFRTARARDTMWASITAATDDEQEG